MKLLTQFIRQLNTPAQLWAPDGTVLLTNARFNELFRLPALLDWSRYNLSLITDPQAVDAGVAAMFRRALEGMPTEIQSFTYETARNPEANQDEQETLVLGFDLQPLLTQTGELVCVVCLVTDHASTGARLEHELMRSQKMENVERLASGVAHEFNNIFTGIKGMTELIKDEVDQTSEIREFADIIHQNIGRGAELIQQLSSFARDVPVNLRRMTLSAYLERALPLMQMHVQRGVTIETDVKRDGEVLIDASRMDQALANLLLNARDAMGGQGTIRIVIDDTAPTPSPGHVLPEGIEWRMIEIADSGPGIPPELRLRALEPFFTTKERGKATGLGLSVASRIILSHNGMLTVGESADLGGAALRVFLPLAAADSETGESN